MKIFVFVVGLAAIASSCAWAQDNGSKGPYGQLPVYSAGSYAGLPPGADQRFDPTAHYWDYYRLEPGHGTDVDRTTPP